MSLQSQVTTLLEMGMSDRIAMFGKTGRMKDQDANPTRTFNCYYTPVRSSEQLTEALFKEIHDSIVHVCDRGFCGPEHAILPDMPDREPAGPSTVKLNLSVANSTATASIANITWKV